jgi:thiamine pyrophosphokinase
METASLVLNGDLDLVWISYVLLGKSNIYCTDGAYDKIRVLQKFGSFNIEAVIGDMDSIRSPSDAKLIKMPDQDYTDFEKALQYLSKAFQNIDIYGASGKEMDHFLGNLSAAKKYKDKLQLKFLEHDYCYFFMGKDMQFDTRKGKAISILPFPKVESITTEGLEYELKEATLELGNLISVRNKAKSNPVRIQYKDGCAVLFIYT